MKLSKSLLAIVLFFCSSVLMAQADKMSIKYRRSSIYTIMIDDAGLVKADTIKRSFLASPVPDKYNDHNLPIRTFKLTDVVLTPEERISKDDNEIKSWGKELLDAGTGGMVDTTNTKEIPVKIEKFLKTNRIASGMVAKWFNRKENGAFDMSLIGDRGMWDATEMSANVAKKTTRGLSMLADAGEELIGNTFVVVTRFKYVDKKEVAEASKGLLSVAAQLGGVSTDVADIVSTGLSVAAKGYVVQTTSYLYKLEWNDSVAAVFYQSYWMDDKSIDPKKKEAFDTTNLFRLIPVGTEKAWADVQSTIFTKKTEEDLVRIATVNAIDAVIAKLQKKYDVFKTKTPLFTTEPITAKIGLKESLEKGDKFEVLEQQIDEKTGKTKYVRLGTIKVDGAQIWDNRYMAGVVANADTSIDRTLFKGGSSKLYPGLLIRQIK